MDRRDGWQFYLRDHADGVFTIAASVLFLLVCYIPWFSIFLPGDSPPDWLPLSPIGQMDGSVGAQSTWLFLLVGLLVFGLGIAALLRRNAVWRNALGLSIGALLVSLALAQIMVAMGVSSVLAGHAASGVVLRPEPGFLLLCSAVGCFFGALWVAWGRVRFRGRS